LPGGLFELLDQREIVESGQPPDDRSFFVDQRHQIDADGNGGAVSGDHFSAPVAAGFPVGNRVFQ